MLILYKYYIVLNSVILNKSKKEKKCTFFCRDINLVVFYMFRASLWSGAWNQILDFQNQTWWCFCSSIPVWQKTVENMGLNGMRRALSNAQFSKDLKSSCKIPQSTGRWFILFCKFTVCNYLQISLISIFWLSFSR